MDLLAIDPGALSGFAYFSCVDGEWRLVEAWASPPTIERTVATPCVLVVEFPKIYPGGRARPDDILKLAAIAGMYEERYKRADLKRRAHPRDWKGTVDGDIMTSRIKAALTPAERVVCAPCAYDHNMLDAVGLGKWALRQPWMRVRASSR